MNNTVRFALVLTVVCAAAAAGVGAVYRLTREPIRRKAANEESRLREDVLPGARVFAEIDPGSGVYAGRESEDGPVVGYVAVGIGSGYGGELKLMVGLDPDLVIVKAAVLSQRETPGLGADLSKVKSRDTLWDKLAGRPESRGVSWLDQFGGKPFGQLNATGIEAKTGCTITGNAIINAARNAVQQARQALEQTGRPRGSNE
jgi:electron transport complex protein RnfG